MIALRVLAPVLVDFSCGAGASLREGTEYADFWQGCESEVANGAVVLADQPAVTFEHARRVSQLNLYQTTDSDSSGRPLNVLTLSWQRPATAFRDVVGTATAHSVESVEVLLYDHGIALVEVLVHFPDLLQEPDLEAALADMQRYAIDLGESIASAAVTSYLDPIIELARACDPDKRHVLSRSAADSFGAADFGSPMWVARSIFVSAQTSAERDRALGIWLENVTAHDGDNPAVEEILAGRTSRSVKWLNYAFLDDRKPLGTVAAGAHEDDWQALRLAQYFYAALDRIDSLLMRVLADAEAAESSGRLESLRRQLVGLSQRAELLIMERHRISKYLSRSVRTKMDALLQYWDQDRLIEEPVRFKIELCNRRLAEIAARRSARSAVFTDVILLGIGVTSILATALAVSEFGRTSRSDPDQSAYDLGRSSLIEWFASQPADAVLVVSGVVSALLVALYLFFRRNDH